MPIDGYYDNVGNQMLHALQRANQKDGIDRSEIAEIRQGAYEDGNLSDGEALLLEKLEAATKDGSRIQDFQFSNFRPSTVQFSQTTLRVDKHKAEIHPTQKDLTRSGQDRMRVSTDLMDFGQGIQAARASGQSPPDYFRGIANQLHQEASYLKTGISWAEKLDPPSPALAQHYRKMIDLVDKLAEIQSHWASSIDESRGKEAADVSLGKIHEAQALLSQMDPGLMDPQTHSRLSQVLKDHEDRVSRYGQEHIDNFLLLDLIWPDEDLGQFVMRTTPSIEPRPLRARLSSDGPAVSQTERLQNFREINSFPLSLMRKQAETQQSLDDLLTPYLAAASSRLRDYIRDPDSVSENDHANLREEFTALFKSNPRLAQQAAQIMTSLRNDFYEPRMNTISAYLRARKHGQTELGTELAGQLRSLTRLESQVVRHWQRDRQFLLEGLVVAARESNEVAQRTKDERAWISSTQNAYARSLLEDPSNRDALSQDFETKIHSESAADIREKIEKTTRTFGAPVRTVPMALVSEGTGATLNFNAYVYQDGEQYKVLNPMDQRLYSGASPEAALQALGRESRMLEGQLHFHDGKDMQQFVNHAPADSSTWDLVMSGVGLVGAGILICIPTPVTTGGGLAVGAAILGVGASSTYFVAKGAGQMYDLIRNDNFGNNRNTWMAAVDIASGLLGIAGAAGRGASLVTAAETGAGTVGGVRAALLQSLNSLGSSRKLLLAEMADGGVGVTLAAQQIYDIANNAQLSDRQKSLAITQIVMFTATPFVMAGMVARNQQQAISRTEMQHTHSEYMENLRTLEQTLNASDLPGVEQVAKTNLEPLLHQMEMYYDSPALKDKPVMRSEGLAQIASLRTRLSKLEMASDLRETTRSRAQALIQAAIPVDGSAPTLSKRKLNDLAATSQAAFVVDGRRFSSPSFENITGVTNGVDAPKVPGLFRDNEAQVNRITDIDQYIDFVELKYLETGNKLNDQTKALIREHLQNIRDYHDGQIPFKHGFPGLHAEVQAANHVFNQLESNGLLKQDLDLREIYVSTFKLGPTNKLDTQGGPFHACPNCTGILHKMTVLTGLRNWDE